MEWSTLHVDPQTLRGHAQPDDLQLTKGVFSTYIGFARAGDCGGRHSARGEIVIDLRGTPFKVEGPGSCSAQAPGNVVAVCSQWTTDACTYPNVTLACSDNNQRCVVRCGGNSGYCFLAKGYLQLAVHNKTQFQALPGQRGRLPTPRDFCVTSARDPFFACTYRACPKPSWKPHGKRTDSGGYAVLALILFLVTPFVTFLVLCVPQCQSSSCPPQFISQPS